MLNSARMVMLGLSLFLAGAGASAQRSATPPPPPASGMPQLPPGFFEHLRELEARYHAMPDTAGTGRYPAVKEEVAGLADHVVYRPGDLSRVPPRGLAILAWGNGGCSADGAGSRLHLAEIASHGYLVIASGRIASGPGIAELPPPPPPAPGGPPNIPPPATSAAQLVQAIDWAIAENGRPGSPLFGKIDTSAIAVSGWSCGGLQALQIAASDPRVSTAIIHNSGIFAASSPMRGMDIGKATLDRLHAPVLYVLGGPSDIAYANGFDDFHRISRVPAALAVLGDVGHGGSFMEPNGGHAAEVAVAWLDWQLKHDSAAAHWFVGADCRLCGDPLWTYDSRNMAAH